MKAMSVLALAAMGVAGVLAAGAAEAQTMGTTPGAGQGTYQPSQAQAPSSVRFAPDGSFRDECGFRYNSRGDRIDARGRVLPPPRTAPGGGSCR
jgi:hypothetical protein